MGGSRFPVGLMLGGLTVALLAACAAAHHAATTNQSHSAGSSPSPSNVARSAAPLRTPVTMKPGETPQQYAQDITAILSNWNNAGATPESYKKLYTPDANGDTPLDTTFVAQVAKEEAPQFTQALFGTTDLSQLSSDNKSFIEQAINENEAILNNYLSTVDKNANSLNIQPYSTSLTMDTLRNSVTNSDGSLYITFDVVEHEQIDNSVGQEEKAQGKKGLNGYVDHVSVTLKQQGDQEVINTIGIN